MYEDLTTRNKSFLKRFSHISRFRIAVDLLNPEPGDRILDYGTGDGFMLKSIRSANNLCHIVGYEPVPHMYETLVNKLREDAANDSIDVVNDIGDVSGTFNKIC